MPGRLAVAMSATFACFNDEGCIQPIANSSIGVFERIRVPSRP